VSVEDGMIDIPERPGLGLPIREDCSFAASAGKDHMTSERDLVSAMCAEFFLQRKYEEAKRFIKSASLPSPIQDRYAA